MSHLDTIVALATPQGHSGIGVIRISGTLVSEISHILLKIVPHPRKATYLALYNHNNEILDNIIAIFFSKPHSFTGEDILEIHGHGNPIILEIIIQNVLNISPKKIRIALPGEFSERAFMNNKIDLIQAESIADLINAKTYQAARLASNTLQGNFSKKINKLEKKISNLQVYLESNIDFPNEKIQILNLQTINKQIENTIDEVKKIQEHAKENTLIQQGIKIVITGEPNSGKSSLFNLLSKQKAAIVTSIPGTTRDTLHKFIQLDGISINIVDTAGLRSINNPAKEKQINRIEKIGIQKAWNEIKQANHIFLVIDISKTSNIECYKLQSKIKKNLPKNNKTPITIIENKADLIQKKTNITYTKQNTIITISAKYNQGINLITKHLQKNIIKPINNTDEHFIVHQRHIDALKLIHYHLLQANQIIKSYFTNNVEQEIEILAEELRYAYIELNKITGKYNSNKLLRKIFATFCIGK